MRTGSPGSRPARCRSRSRTRRPTPRRCSPRRGPATRTASRWRCSPSSALSGYAIDDLFLQDTLLDGVLAAVDEIVAASTDLRPVLVVGAPLVHGTRVLNCAVVIHRGADPRRRPEVLPADLPRVLRAPPLRARRRPAGEHHQRRRRRGTVRAGPALQRHRRPGLTLHVEICEDMWVPVPPSAEAALAGATVLANLSGSPITVGPRRGPPAAGRARPARAASRRTSTPPPARASRPPTCRGTARRWSTRWASCSPRPSASPTGRGAPSPTSTSTGCARSGCGRAPSTTTGGRTAEPRSRQFRTIAFTLEPPAGDIGLRRKVDRFPFVPDDAERLALDCYEAYNIQVSGLEQRLRAIGQPQGGHRRLRRPRLHARADRRGPGDGPARPPAQRHPRVHHAGLRDRRDHEVQRHAARPRRSA